MKNIYIYIYTLAWLRCTTCVGHLGWLFKLNPHPRHQHCTDEAQKAETVLSAVSYIYINDIYINDIYIYIYIYITTGVSSGLCFRAKPLL